MRIARLTVFHLLLALLALPGCSSISPPPSSSVTQPQRVAGPVAKQWWYVRFQIPWPPATRPDWAMHALLADQVCRPVLNRFGETLDYWRFHRRAGRDAAGHLFSFIFYTDALNAEAIFRQIDANPLALRLLQSGVLEAIRKEAPGGQAGAPVEAGSDPHWTVPIQQTWPDFIMGASRLWLGLIERLHPGAMSPSHDTATLLAHYRRLHETINAIWQRDGQHAFLHHLSAVFAYQALPVRF